MYLLTYLLRSRHLNQPVSSLIHAGISQSTFLKQKSSFSPLSSFFFCLYLVVMILFFPRPNLSNHQILLFVYPNLSFVFLSIAAVWIQMFVTSYLNLGSKFCTCLVAPNLLILYPPDFLPCICYHVTHYCAPIFFSFPSIYRIESKLLSWHWRLCNLTPSALLVSVLVISNL